MIISKKAISRRTVLRGLGATISLPLLDSMVPAMTGLAQSPARPVHRFGVVYVPNGMVMENYLPVTQGPGFEMTPTLQGIAPFRERVLVLTRERPSVLPTAPNKLVRIMGSDRSAPMCHPIRLMKLYACVASLASADCTPSPMLSPRPTKGTGG